MPSHVDGYISAWYAVLLSSKYEHLIRDLGIEPSVLAYRTGNGTNYSMAEAAFTEIAGRPSCLAVALDISDFFPSIDHQVLRRNWADVLGTDGLPPDHFAVFRAMTCYAEVQLDTCLRRLGIDPRADRVPRPLCNGRNFRSLIRGGGLIVPNSKTHGIPQGAQISAILSNISMLRFDERMRAAAASMGGSYRRYSDDILFLVDFALSKSDVEKVVEDGLLLLGPAMKLNKDKTEAARFVRDEGGHLLCDKKMVFSISASPSMASGG